MIRFLYFLYVLILAALVAGIAYWLVSLWPLLKTETQSGDHDRWYLEEYVPLWETTPWETREQLTALYAEELDEHPNDDFQVTTINDGTLYQEDMESWRVDGWIAAKMVNYQSELLNDTTATYKVKWQDVYDDGTVEISCGWYMADHNDETWRMTQYAELDCEMHGL
ncbi:MAG: hypothetical protein AAF431_17330 [Pseudomonadota bacterium]